MGDVSLSGWEDFAVHPPCCEKSQNQAGALRLRPLFVQPPGWTLLNVFSL